MKTKVIYILLTLLTILNSIAQEIPRIKVGKEEIKVRKIAIKTEIIGNIATTTYDMSFFNPNDRILEGELIFPLGENQSVYRFALEINGNLREAVVVEKEKARVAFESTVRNKIDPALLEKGQGNNYKARIYPIPARGYKRVVIGFQQKLAINNEAYYYKLPFNFKQKLESFSLSIKVLDQKNKPSIRNGEIPEFTYNTVSGVYYTNIKRRKQQVNQPVLIKIPLNTKEGKIIANKSFFYIAKNLKIKRKAQKLEENITIHWDASLSRKNRKNVSEYALLKAYFSKINNCRVKLVVFGTRIREEKYFNVKNGNWAALKEKLNTIIYDGGTSFEFLKTYKDRSKLDIIFTDGLNTLEDFEISFAKKTFIVNSSSSAKHLILKDKANRSGGDYINLNQSSVEKAIQKFTESKLQFLGTNYDSNEIEIYPKKGSIIDDNFSLVGKGNIIGKKIKVYVGIQNKITKTLEFNIEKENIRDNFIAKMWAQSKLNVLSLNKEHNEKEIMELSKTYQVISPFTLLLILDRIEDYVTHEIVPPIELQDQYYKQLALKVNNKKDQLARLEQQLFNGYSNFFKLYDKEYKLTETSRKDRNNSRNRITEGVITEVERSVEVTDGEFFVSGVVSDKTGPLPGVQVMVKGTSRGIETDFDGNYSVKVKTGDSLIFSFVGMKTMEKVIGNTNGVNVILASDDVLEEVVIVGYGTTNQDEEVEELVAPAVMSQAMEISSSESDNGFKRRVTNKIGRSRQVNNNSLATNDLEIDANFKSFEKKRITLKGWNPKTPYLEKLRTINTTKEAYSEYLKLRKKYGSSPSFYIDVADFFKNRKEQKIAVQILTNVAELEVDNYELLKALAYKFEAYELYDYAVFIYKEVLKLRPEDIQSYRDLALAYEHVNEYQKSVDLLYQIVNGELLVKDTNRRFSGLEGIALVELNRMIELYGKKIQTAHFNTKYLKKLTADIRVLIDWNHNDTDIDLWVIDPNGEKCYYSHKETKIGGLMSEDMTRGFGPEQFLLKKALKGSYSVKVKYYGSTQQKISGPTFLKITTFKNYGKKNELKFTELVRLKNVSDILDLGNVEF